MQAERPWHCLLAVAHFLLVAVDALATVGANDVAFDFAAVRESILAKVDEDVVHTVRDSHLPIHIPRTRAVAVEVVDPEPIVPVQSTAAARVVDVGIAIAVPAIVEVAATVMAEA